MGHFNARTETGRASLPDMRVIAPDQPRSVVRGRRLTLNLPSHGGVMASSIPHGFPFGRISTYPVDLFNYRTVASPHRRTVAGAPVPIGSYIYYRKTTWENM